MREKWTGYTSMTIPKKTPMPNLCFDSETVNLGNYIPTKYQNGQKIYFNAKTINVNAIHKCAQQKNAESSGGDGYFLYLWGKFM